MLTPEQLENKTIDILTPRVGTDRAKQLAEKLKFNASEILSQSVSTTLMINDAKQEIETLLEELTRRELCSINLERSEMNKALNKLLSKYTNDNSKKQAIAEVVKEMIIDSFKSSTYPYHLLDDSIRSHIYEELEALPEVLKDVDYETFFFDYVLFLEAYAELIHDVQDKLDAEIKTPLVKHFDTSISPAQDLIDEQAAMLKFYTEDLLVDVFKEITEIRADLTSLKKQYYDACMSDAPQIISDNELRQYQAEAKQLSEVLCLEAEFNVMDTAILKWLNHKPAILKQLIDFDALKAKARNYAIHNEAVDQYNEEEQYIRDIEKSLLQNPKFLTPEQLQNFAELLSEFMNSAKQKNLDYLLKPEVGVRLNPENRKFHFYAQQFVEFFNLLPYSIKEVFIKQDATVPFTAQQLIGLDLDGWHKSEKATQACMGFLKNEKVLPATEGYLNWYNTHVANKIVKKYYEYERLEQAEMKQVLSAKNCNSIDAIREKSVLTAAKQNNMELFNLFIRKCNIPTLVDIIEKLPKEAEEYTSKAQARLARLESIGKNQFNFFASPRKNCAANIDLQGLLNEQRTRPQVKMGS